MLFTGAIKRHEGKLILEKYIIPFRFGRNYDSSDWNFLALVGFLILVFLTGGSSRDDVESLMFLRPVAIIMCGAAAINLKIAHIKRSVWVFGGFSTIFMLSLLYLIPFPSTIWMRLPSNYLPVTVGHLTELGDVWRPLALVPESTLNAIFSLFIPGAALLLTLQLDRKRLYQLLPVLIALGVLSGVFGLLQLAGPTGNPSYLYRITNDSAAVGLFANRNHASLFLALLFPFLAVFAFDTSAQSRIRKGQRLAAAAIATILVPLILITGSRSGLFIAIIGLLGATLVYLRSRGVRGTMSMDVRSDIFGIPTLIGTGIVSLGLLTFFFSRASAVDRLFLGPLATDNRGDVWPITVKLISQYFPTGTGPGGFAEAFEVSEPLRLLDPTYLNRAHNDWIEALVLMGAPSVVLLMLALSFFFYRCYELWKQSNQAGSSVAFGRMASIGIAMTATGSLTDYPLHTPLVMCVFLIMAIWCWQPTKKT